METKLRKKGSTERKVGVEAPECGQERTLG